MGQGVIKGICDLHQFLHKAQMRLTQAWLLMCNDLGHMRKFLGINKLRDSYSQKTP